MGSRSSRPSTLGPQPPARRRLPGSPTPRWSVGSSGTRSYQNILLGLALVLTGAAVTVGDCRALSAG